MTLNTDHVSYTLQIIFFCLSNGRSIMHIQTWMFDEVLSIRRWGRSLTCPMFFRGSKLKYRITLVTGNLFIFQILKEGHKKCIFSFVSQVDISSVKLSSNSDLHIHHSVETNSEEIHVSLDTSPVLPHCTSLQQLEFELNESEEADHTKKTLSIKHQLVIVLSQ